jgi:hypothetical protein
MNRQRVAWLLLLMATALALIFSYWSPLQGARPTRVVIGRDVGDANNTARQGSAKAGYEPYFTKANPIPTEIK